MRRLRYVFLGCVAAAGLVFAAVGGAGCNLLGGCETDTATKESDTLSLSPGQSLVLTDLNCTTGKDCDHATVKAQWNIQSGSSVSGTVRLEVHAICPDYLGGFIGDSASKSVNASTGSGSIDKFEAINNRMPCGDNVREYDQATLTNNSNEELVAPLITLVCPKYVTPASSLAPSATIRR